MYIAIKPFRYRGQKFNAGDEVPASAWPSRRALEARRKIRFVAPNPATVTGAQLRKMHRAELDVHARKVGIEDPESFPNRDLLLKAINGEALDDDEEVDDSQDDNTEVDDTGSDDSEEVPESDDPDTEDSEDQDAEEDASDETEGDDSE